MDLAVNENSTNAFRCASEFLLASNTHLIDEHAQAANLVCGVEWRNVQVVPHIVDHVQAFLIASMQRRQCQARASPRLKVNKA